ncbi:Alpha/Beta hydrolase protein [Phakopsora pachyrhizi]|nr:Alpha/Beta hydrolase protein [Phakopsora pachyrhizi]
MGPAEVSYSEPSPSTPFSNLIPNQIIANVSHLKLVSGVILKDVPIAYRVWGKLNQEGNNCMVICHALTGSADVEDWWGPLMGPGLVFDPTRYFIFCANVLGSPYGTASPVTVNPATGKRWGPEFPSTTPRDDIALQKIILDHLGVRSISVVIGGSMGGMTCLEWPLCTPSGYVHNIVPIATCPRHSAWGISWGEAQRQSIYSDPKYLGGYYDEKDPPVIGLAAARMAALLTYRSRDSFENRFGRKQVALSESQSINGTGSSDPRSASVGDERQLKNATVKAVAAHNEGHRLQSQTKEGNHLGECLAENEIPVSQIFSAQSYLRYQGDKFVARFDANCYIHLTRKLDSHDVNNGRQGNALSLVPHGALVVAINTDGLFTLIEQRELTNSLPDAKLVIVESTDGHDGFLLEFEQINRHVLNHLKARLPQLYSSKTAPETGEISETPIFKKGVLRGVEGDITNW